jgi:hypothetical protein
MSKLMHYGCVILILTFSSAAFAAAGAPIENYVYKKVTSSNQSFGPLFSQAGIARSEAVSTPLVHQFLIPSTTRNTHTANVNRSKEDGHSKCLVCPRELQQFVLCVLIVVVTFTARCAIKKKLRELARRA